MRVITREGSKDKGHWARKAIWLTLAVLLFIPYLLCLAGRFAAEWIEHFGERMYVFSHPCLFVRRMPRKQANHG